MNLLNETIEKIAVLDLRPRDIVFIGSKDGKYGCSWDEFITLANKEYDNSYGAAEVVMDLIIVFDNGGVMHRGEYDGAEWWEYTPVFTRKENPKPIIDLFTGSRLSDE